jgi:DNA-binding NtrC family response regulator
MTAFSRSVAIELVKLGAYDYLTKPLATSELLSVVTRALAESRLKRETARLHRGSAGEIPPEFIGSSPPMLELYQLIRRSAGLPHAVLITGESGTGKELVARALHRLSGRGSFVTVNCGALPEALLESELFGHERGAFTGADRAKAGLFQVASGGTLLLDELAELPLSLQPKLLHVLEQDEIRPVSATTPSPVDTRVLAATNRNLEADVEAGRFRDDLYWRLNVLTIALPPLRERASDIPLLARHFLEHAAPDTTGGGQPRELAPETMQALTRYPWPGNVRELRNDHRAAWLAREHPRRASARPGPGATDINALWRGCPPAHPPGTGYFCILKRSGAATATDKGRRLLGVDRKTLYRKGVYRDWRPDQPA